MTQAGELLLGAETNAFAGKNQIRWQRELLTQTLELVIASLASLGLGELAVVELCCTLSDPGSG